MNKELPKMYQKKVSKTVPSIQKVFSTIEEERKMNKREDINHEYSSISIAKKIDDIFSAPDFVYKADVVIVTDIDTIKRRIVARDKSNIVTINNEYIPIAIIRDIYKEN